MLDNFIKFLFELFEFEVIDFTGLETLYFLICKFEIYLIIRQQVFFYQIFLDINIIHLRCIHIIYKCGRAFRMISYKTKTFANLNR